jgi:hypothetical protein
MRRPVGGGMAVKSGIGGAGAVPHAAVCRVIASSRWETAHAWMRRGAGDQPRGRAGGWNEFQLAVHAAPLNGTGGARSWSCAAVKRSTSFMVPPQ